MKGRLVEGGDLQVCGVGLRPGVHASMKGRLIEGGDQVGHVGLRPRVHASMKGRLVKGGDPGRWRPTGPN